MTERISELLGKVKALADRGVAGEKVAASELLKKLLAKYGVKEEDLESEERKERSFYAGKKGTYGYRLILQVIVSVIAEGNPYTYPMRRGGEHLVFARMTEAEYVEAREKVSFYNQYYKQSLEEHYVAFVHANELFAKNPNSVNPKERSKEELWRIAQMTNSIEKKVPVKKLESVKLNQSNS